MSQEWKLVPVEPTVEMENSGREECYGYCPRCDTDVQIRSGIQVDAYRAMLAAAPAPPAGGDVEVLATVNARGILERKGVLRSVELVDRAHVTRLQAEVERLQVAADGNFRQANENAVERDKVNAHRAELIAERDALKAEVDRLKRSAHGLIDEIRTRDIELTKARELLASTSARLHSAHRNIDRLFELEPQHRVKLLTDALHTVVYAYKCIDNPAHQSAPAASSDDGGYTDYDLCKQSAPVAKLCPECNQSHCLGVCVEKGDAEESYSSRMGGE